jgi:uncharacterized ParB-like nuclease family protein
VIPADAVLKVAWLDVADVVPDPPQELALATVAYYAGLLADTAGHLAPPLVSAADERGRYAIRDGYHRWAAHVALGRERIRCVVVKEA